MGYQHKILEGSFMDTARRALPEENLLAALILRAYYDLFDKRVDLQQDALAWFRGEVPEGHEPPPFSFTRACELLGIEAGDFWKTIQKQLEKPVEVVESQYVAGDARRPTRPGRVGMGYFAAQLNAEGRGPVPVKNV